MIVGIGCDIVDHEMTTKLGWLSNKHIINRILSPPELAIFEKQKNINFISGRFAAKEALLKCLGTGMKDGISLLDISVIQTDNFQPVIQIDGELKKLIQLMKIDRWHISISHTPNSSLAFVIAISNDNICFKK